MGGGGSKSLAKKRAKEFAASDDDDNDDDDREDFHVNRSLYKILNGDLASLEKGQHVREFRCRWCHDNHDEALSLQCLCSSHRISDKRLQAAVLHRSFPTSSEVILDHAYKSRSSGNPVGGTPFMAIIEQEYLQRRDAERAVVVLRAQKKLGRQSALKLIKRLRMASQLKILTDWKNRARWQKLIHTEFRKFDTDDSGSLDAGEVLKALNGLGGSLSLKNVGVLLSKVGANLASEIDLDLFVSMIEMMEDDDSKPEWQAMVEKMKKAGNVDLEAEKKMAEMKKIASQKKQDVDAAGTPEKGNKPGNTAAQNALADRKAITDSPEKMIKKVRPVWMPAAVDACKTRDTRGRLPLHNLCCNDAVTPSMIKILLDAHSVAVLCLDLEGCLPLHLLCSNPAVTEPHIEALIEVMRKFAPDGATVASLIQSLDAWEQLPLHRLCANSYIYPELLDCLVKLDLSAVRKKDGKGWTPIQHLLRNRGWSGGHGAGAKAVGSKMLEMLFVYGCDLKEAQRRPKQPKFHVSKDRDASSEEEESSEDEDFPEDGSLITTPHSISERDRTGQNSMHLICENLHANQNLIKWALDKEFEAMAFDVVQALDHRPWQTFWEFGPRGSGFYLNRNGGSVGKEEPNTHPKGCGSMLMEMDESGSTPLSILCQAPLGSTSSKSDKEARRRHLKMLQCIVKACKTACQVADHAGRLPLHYILANPGVTDKSFNLVAGSSASVAFRTADAWGSLPLHLLCWNPALSETIGHRLVKIALKGGPSSLLGEEDAEGRTPLHCLTEGPACNKDLVKMLFKRFPAAVCRVDMIGRTPAECAAGNPFLTAKGRKSMWKYVYSLEKKQQKMGGKYARSTDVDGSASEKSMDDDDEEGQDDKVDRPGWGARLMNSKFVQGLQARLMVKDEDDEKNEGEEGEGGEGGDGEGGDQEKDEASVDEASDEGGEESEVFQESSLDDLGQHSEGSEDGADEGRRRRVKEKAGSEGLREASQETSEEDLKWQEGSQEGSQEESQEGSQTDSRGGKGVKARGSFKGENRVAWADDLENG